MRTFRDTFVSLNVDRHFDRGPVIHNIGIFQHVYYIGTWWQNVKDHNANYPLAKENKTHKQAKPKNIAKIMPTRENEKHNRMWKPMPTKPLTTAILVWILLDMCGGTKVSGVRTHTIFLGILETRTVARKFSIRGLCVSAGGFTFVRGAWHSKNWQNSPDL